MATVLSNKIRKGVEAIQSIDDPAVIQEVVTQLMDSKLFKSALMAQLGISDMAAKIAALEERVDDAEQYSRRTCLKFRGISESSGEDTDDLIVSACNDSLGVMVTKEDISRSHRVPAGPYSADRPARDIIVRFISYRTRAEIYQARSAVFGLRRESDSSESISSSVPPPFYVNEALTKQRAAVFAKARHLKSIGAFDRAYTRDGRIIVRDTKGKGFKFTKLSEMSNYPDPPPKKSTHIGATTSSSARLSAASSNTKHVAPLKPLDTSTPKQNNKPSSQSVMKDNNKNRFSTISGFTTQ